MGVSSELGFSFPKTLSVWWSEETDSVLQRIERWAAYARGYNRLRSVRLSPGRMTMQDEPEARWRIDRRTNRLVVEQDWAPSFRRGHKATASAERSRLKCCALDYKSNGNLDSNCLEAYSMDHSIYFKTVGEIRREVNGNENKSNGSSAEEPKSPPTTPIDCGDFLASDFDEDEDEELAELDLADYDLRDQLEQLELNEQAGVIQVCRSVIDEDELNNNIMLMGFQRKLAPATAAAVAQ